MVQDHEGKGCAAADSIFGVWSGVIDDRATRVTARFQDAAAREDSMNPKETSGTLFPSCPRSWNGRVTARDRVVDANDRRKWKSRDRQCRRRNVIESWTRFTGRVSGQPTRHAAISPGFALSFPRRGLSAASGKMRKILRSRMTRAENHDDCISRARGLVVVKREISGSLAWILAEPRFNGWITRVFKLDKLNGRNGGTDCAF
jgi:hypothetical protein